LRIQSFSVGEKTLYRAKKQSEPSTWFSTVIRIELRYTVICLPMPTLFLVPNLACQAADPAFHYDENQLSFVGFVS
jgi:hypothetical protein